MPRERSGILAALTSKGFGLEQGSRDHDFLFFWYEGKRQPVFTKLSRGTQYKTVGDPLLSKMSRQLHLTKKEFGNLVDCPMSEADFIERLVQQGVLAPAAKPVNDAKPHKK
jgi:hypothetical protein